MTPLRVSVCLSGFHVVRTASWAALVRFQQLQLLFFLLQWVGKDGNENEVEEEVEAAWFLCTARVLRVEFVA